MIILKIYFSVFSNGNAIPPMVLDNEMMLQNEISMDLAWKRRNNVLKHSGHEAGSGSYATTASPVCEGIGDGAIVYQVTSRQQQPIYILTWNC